MELTPSQQKAATTLDKNLVVTAGAGSGKTTVLVDRFLHILTTREARLDEVIAITFTKKAASEMKQRIRQQVDKRLQQNLKAEEFAYWLEIKANVEAAKISTIHSLGLFILRQNPVEAGIDPGSTMIDEIQAQVMLDDIVTSLLIKYGEANDAGIMQLIEDCGVSQAAKKLQQVYLTARASGQDFNKLTSARDDNLQEQLLQARLRINGLMKEVIEICESKGGTSKFVARWRSFDHQSHLDLMSSIDSCTEYTYNLCRTNLDNLCKGRSIKEAKDHIDDIKEAIEQWSMLLAELDAQQVISSMAAMLGAIDKQYTQAKLRNHWLDYTDLEVGLLRLLQKYQNIREYYQQQFKFVLVDEFQDTNTLQQQIIQLISPLNKSGLFVVGDAKQSIYRFRGAEVGGFVNMAQAMADNGGEAVNLETNFRSKRSLIEFFNIFFGQVFDSESLINYQPVSYFHEDDRCTHKVEVILPPQADDKLGAAEARRLEAQLIAQRIVELVDEGQFDYRDIALLFRALTDIKVYERALSDWGIPFVTIGGRGFFERQEIYDCLNLLHYLHNPNDAIRLVGLLRSPFLGLSDEGLYWLQDKGLLGTLSGEHPNMSLSDRRVWQSSKSLLRKWIELQSYLKPSELLRRALLETDYQTVLLASDGYQLQAWANVEKLLALVRQIESQQSITSWTGVLDYLEMMAQDTTLVSEATISAESDDAVRLMTIHQSKGLEFPVVIVPDVARTTRNPDYGPVFYDSDIGLLYRVRDYSGQLLKTRKYCQYYDHNDALEWSEYKRLLYVAATRAEDYLILSGIPDKIRDRGSIDSCKTWFDWAALFVKLKDWPEESSTEHEHVLISVLSGERQSLRSGKVSVATANIVNETDSDLSSPLVKRQSGLYTISVTSILDYVTCPQLFYQRYVQRLAQPQQMTALEKEDNSNAIDPLALGNLVHRVCEDLSGGQSLEELLVNAFQTLGIESTLSQKYKQAALPMLNSYQGSSLYQTVLAAAKVENEVPFRLYQEEMEITGQVDKVLTLPNDELVLIDFKSNNITASQVDHMAKHYQPQMAVYALALSRYYGKMPQKQWLYFLKPGSMVNCAELGNEEQCQEIVSAYVQPIKESINIGNFTAKTTNCYFCSYRVICRYAK